MSKAWYALHARPLEDGVTITLPGEIADCLGISEGGLIATWDKDGSLSLVGGSDTEHGVQMAIARQVMRNDRAVLAALAKA